MIFRSSGMPKYAADFYKATCYIRRQSREITKFLNTRYHKSYSQSSYIDGNPLRDREECAKRPKSEKRKIDASYEDVTLKSLVFRYETGTKMVVLTLKVW